jgi:hypothetical protein
VHSLVLALLLTTSNIDLSGYWLGESENRDRIFLTLRDDSGLYISLQQFLNVEEVDKWQYQFGYWNVEGSKLKVNIIGGYSGGKMKLLKSCSGQEVAYELTFFETGKLNYKSYKSGEIYSVVNTVSQTDKDKISPSIIKKFKKKLMLHNNECQ